MPRHLALWFALLGFFPVLLAQWHPDAGLTQPWSRQADVSLHATSGASTLPHLNDGASSTQWVSDPLLPVGFLRRNDLNAMADPSRYQVSGTSLPDLSVIADGSLYGMSKIEGRGAAWVSFSFDQPQPITRVYGRFRSGGAPIQIFALRSRGDSVLLTEIPIGRYVWESWEVPGSPISGLVIKSDEDFYLNEIGALTGPLTETVVMDLGQERHVCQLRSRHWSTAAEAIAVSVSSDSLSWQPLLTLDPQAMLTQVYALPETTHFRYLRYEYEVVALNYKKLYLWEIELNDHRGSYGLIPTPGSSSPSLEAMLGINAFWGWGYNRYTDGLLPGEGPEMYQPVASFARNYHNMHWDIEDPDDDISFADMAAHDSTPAQWWLNWEREYAAWIDKDMPVMASIQFVHFPDTAWDHPYRSAYKYGFSFGRFFGPTHGNGQVRIVEVGNEPWQYDSALYRTILRGMARGLKAADASLIVLPCALQAHDPGAEASGHKNYLGARLTSTEALYLDGLNLHPYSFFKGEDGIRRAVHPEHIGSNMHSIYSAMRWRDHNMPGKPIYVTEWGWDHAGAGQDCLHNECVSEAEAAAYTTRALLMMQRLGVERAVYFYHSNLWSTGLFTRSGLTGSKEVNFAKKRSFYALQALLAEVGDREFLGILQEDEAAWIYALGDSTGKVTHLIAWRPKAATDTSYYGVPLTTDYTPQRALLIDGLDADGTPINVPQRMGDQLLLSLSTFPTVIEIASVANQEPEFARNIPAPGAVHPREVTLVAELNEAKAQPQSVDPKAWSQKMNPSSLGLTQMAAPRPELGSPLIRIGPIPTQEVLTVALDGDIHPDEVYQLAVWDFQGRKLYSQTKNIQKKNYLRVSHLSPGAYKFVVFLKDGRQFAQTATVID